MKKWNYLMPKIISSLPLLERSIVEKTPLRIKDGAWWPIKGVFRWICKLPIIRSILLKRATQQFIRTLDGLESQKIYSVDHPKGGEQLERLREYSLVGRALLARYGKRLHAQLWRRVEALNQRIQAASGNTPAEAPTNIDTAPLLTHLKNELIAWKKKHLYPSEDIFISHDDALQLNEVLQYAHYVHLLINHKKTLDNFFRATIRDRLPVKEVVQYPSTCDKLHRVYLESRIGVHGGLESITLPSKKGGTKTVLSLPFKLAEKGVKKISILNADKSVRLDGSDREYTINEIFKAFSRKNYCVGDFEYFGAVEFYSCASPPIDPQAPLLIEHLKTVRTMTLDEFQRAFDLPDLEDGQWVKIYRATRSSNKLAVEGCHAFLEIAVPDGKGNYAIKSLGVLAKRYPQTALEALGFLGRTVLGAANSPDDNIYMLNREHCAAPVILKTPDLVQELREQTRKLFTESKSDRLIFQLAGDHNCAAKVQQQFMSAVEKMPNMKGEVKNLFKVPFIKLSPMEPLGMLCRFFRRCPVIFQKIFIRCLEIIFGGYKRLKIRDVDGKMATYSLAKSDFHRTHEVYSPGLLFEKIKDGEIPGVCWYGTSPLNRRSARAA